VNSEQQPGVRLGKRWIARCQRPYIVAEMSANHRGDYQQAVRIVEAAAEAGADAVKLQTYTPDSLTLDSPTPGFRIQGTLWHDRTLYELYREAQTPWDWQPKLAQVAKTCGLDFFSSPFDTAAVDFLETLDVPAYKIASFELVDLPLLRRVAQTGKPVLLSTGMGTLAEIDEAVRTVRAQGNSQILLLKCTSAYPATAAQMNLRTLPRLAECFGLPVGLSDHSLETLAPALAVALGACLIEKHLTLSRAAGGPDCGFSLEPHEFRQMVTAVHTAQQALGHIQWGPTELEDPSRRLRRSLYAVRDIHKGQAFTLANVRSIRPANGLHPRYLERLLGRSAQVDVARGTPLAWHHVG